MKKLVHCFLLAAALGMPGLLYAQDEDAPAQESAAQSEQETDPVAPARKRLEELDKRVAEFQNPSRSFPGRYERAKTNLENNFKRIESSMQKLSEKRAKLKTETYTSYSFDVVPSDARYEYESEGLEMMKKVTALLNGKESEQIAGIPLFEPLYNEYQGIPGYKDAFAQYKKLLEKLERKWSAAKDKVTRDRQKMSTTARTKAEDAESAAYLRQAKKMESAGKSIEKDWFVPTTSMLSNVKLLDQLLQRVRAADRITASEPMEGADLMVEKLRVFWASMDEVVEKMCNGEIDAAQALMSENKAYDDVNSAGRSCMPDKYLKAVRDQYQKLRSDLHSRSRAIHMAQSDVEREKRTFETEVSRLNSAMDNLTNMVDEEKEELDRKAAEEAERKAEEEAERKAAEEEAAEDEGAAATPKADEDKPAKKKKKKKKKSESAE